MIAEDFFKPVASSSSSPSFGDPWGESARQKFDTAMMTQLRRGSVAGKSDVEVAIALSDLLQDELTAYGTGGGEQLDDKEMSAALTAMKAVCGRLSVTFEPPFRNFTTFRTYWNRNDGYGSWQARRDMVAELFDPVHTKLIALEDRSFDALAEPASPRAATGWPAVDEEVRELRRRFQMASTPQDYRALGTNCVGVLEALSRTVYDAEVHLREGETEPPVDKTNMRIERYIEDTLPGKDNEDIRGLTKKSAVVAHRVKHSATATRRDAGIAADAVILLANIIRRLDQDE
ncbi:hypothetical protein SAMN05444374_103189 [Rhodococcoides kroppenstedtii]|uniref:Uncharacterized protein n=1 Tax=Rhodococcoides kroppenstedtii TaxID=293050 RepID=A0A1I0T1W3_9NOCA|nr:hypothetical protein [Rhodococcus kroppenstedtii]SFA45016.1 hypothetical protein SAMN05444374_103189 [Rhodococcus kroppenstedtii]